MAKTRAHPPINHRVITISRPTFSGCVYGVVHQRTRHLRSIRNDKNPARHHHLPGRLSVFSGEKQVYLFIYTILVIAFFEAGTALYHRYVIGMHRIRATLPHPNSLSMYCLQIFPITLSLWFAEDLSKKVRKARAACLSPHSCQCISFIISGRRPPALAVKISNRTNEHKRPIERQEHGVHGPNFLVARG